MHTTERQLRSDVGPLHAITRKPSPAQCSPCVLLEIDAVQYFQAAAGSGLRGSGSLAEIALACGFANQSHFTRVFTRMVGCPPGAWRRAIG